jgi:RNA-directed DNA polymerase
MKRADNLIEAVADLDNLRLATWKAGKGKRHSRQVLAHAHDLDNRLWQLREQILAGRVAVGQYHYFKIYEPKERQICAAAFGEQVLHHALMNVCHPHFDRYLIADSYASRKNKGTHAALARAQEFTQNHAFFLKLDVKKFFGSIHHGVLKGQLARRFKDERLVAIFFQVIDSYQAQPDRGVPIGNLTSQYFANHYLAGLDWFVKQGLRCRGYVRYMDDMVLWHDDKQYLKQAHAQITDYLAHQLRLELKPAQLNRTSLGVPFLGYRQFAPHRRLLHKSKIRFIRKIRRAGSALAAGTIDQAQYQARALPLLAFVRQAKTWHFRQIVLHSDQGNRQKAPTA